MKISVVVLLTGRIIAVGGGIEDAYLSLFIEAVGGKQAKIAIIAAARPTRERQLKSINAYKDYFSKAGLTNITYKVILNKEDANNPEFNKKVAECDGVILTMGDQKYLHDRVYNTNLHKAMLEAYKNNAFIYSNSAGTASLGEWMIVDADATSKRVEIRQGFNFLQGVITDQHFTERKREWRLRKAVEDKKCIGIGIDEESALILFEDNFVVVEDDNIHIIGVK